MKNFGILLCALTATTLHAQKAGSISLFGGAMGGYQMLSTSVTGEKNKKGPNLMIKGVAAYYLHDWVLDGGIGWRYSRLSNSRVALTTQSGVIEVAPRYRLGDDWSVGPLLHLLFGTDLTFTEQISDSKNFLLMPGIQALMEIPGDSLHYRLGGAALIDMKLKNQSTMVFLVDFQIRFADFKKSRRAEKAPPPPQEEVLPVEEAAPIAQVSGEREVLARFPSDKLLFDTAMSHLKPGSRDYLRRFARFLKENEDAWEKVDITGHTDRRGKLAVNRELSEARAQTVFNVLKEAGISEQRMNYAGAGPRYPVDPSDSPAAWAKNRRVEMKFEGVSKPEVFTEGLNSISLR